MQRTAAIKISFFALWLTLLAVVIVAITQQDRFFAVDVKAVAVLESKAGSVVVRPEGLVRWKETVERQSLFDGDRVATGRNSKGKVTFGPGRTIALGENSQVQITAIMSSNKDYAFMIKLLRGTVVAEVEDKCAACQPLVVRAGQQTFNVTSGKKVGLYKAADTKVVKKFNPQKTWPIEPRKQPPVTLVTADFLKDMEKADQPAPAPAPAPTPVPPPPPPPAPAVTAEGYEVDVRPPASGLVYWTVQPLSSLSAVALDFPLSPPAARPKQGDWRPVIEVSSAGGSKAKTEVIAPQGQSDSVVHLPVMKIRSLATVNMRGGIKEYTFSVRGGAEVTRGKKKTQSFSDKRLTAKVVTFGEYSGGPVGIGLDKLAPEAANGSSPWMEPKQDTAVDAAPIAVYLASAVDYAKFMPYIRGASQVGVSRQSFYSNDGIFVVRNQGVAAQLRGSGLGQGEVHALQGLLDGDFTFRGPRSALYDARGAAQNALVDLVGALLDKGKVLYILKRNRLYPVSRDFIKTNSAVAKFIDSQARAIFLEKVEILDYR